MSKGIFYDVAKEAYLSALNKAMFLTARSVGKMMTHDQTVTAVIDTMINNLEEIRKEEIWKKSSPPYTSERIHTDE